MMHLAGRRGSMVVMGGFSRLVVSVDFPSICTPLFNLLKMSDKNTDTAIVTTNSAEPVKKKTNKAPIECIPRCHKVFNELKACFCSAPVLK